MRNRSKLFVQLLFVLLLAGCSIFGGDKDDEREKAKALTETELYQRVQELLDDKSYDLAVKNLQLLESRFPFGNYAEQAQLEIVFAYYISGDEDAAIAAADRFLRLHPQHADADYAWYLKGLANYRLKPGLLSRFHQTNFAAKDVSFARKSFREFQQFLRLYPDSQYAADARIRMIYIKDILARHEVVVANYYLKRRAYTAAIKRANEVLLHYQKTEAIADALALLTFSYYQTGLTDLAQSNLELLTLNFPKHETLDTQGEFKYSADYDLEQRSLLNKVSFGFFDAVQMPVFDSRN